MNKVILMGRLTSDPKMDWTRSEDSKQYATYTLAVNRRFKRMDRQIQILSPALHGEPWRSLQKNL
jgi:single-stranded DNA-binding protein